AECHLGAELPGDGRAAREGIGADRHLRSRSDAQRIEGEEKSRGGRVDGEGPARADEGGELLLEGPRHLSRSEPARAKHLEDGGFLLGPYGRAGERDELSTR